ncbi:hypothetical protein C8R44DRAFT_753462 [Mycena epipterygia]|nr:hypothetical protein C8R44DRAFT_753462 [Mycena epipterygia]
MSAAPLPNPRRSPSLCRPFALRCSTCLRQPVRKQYPPSDTPAYVVGNAALGASKLGSGGWNLVGRAASDHSELPGMRRSVALVPLSVDEPQAAAAPHCDCNLHSENLLLNSQAVLNLNFSNVVLVNPETPLSTDPVAIVYWQAPLPEYLMEALRSTNFYPRPNPHHSLNSTRPRIRLAVSQWPSDHDIVGLDPINRLGASWVGIPIEPLVPFQPVYEDGAQWRRGKLLERQKWVDRICSQRVKQRKPQHRLRATLEFAASRCTAHMPTASSMQKALSNSLFPELQPSPAAEGADRGARSGKGGRLVGCQQAREERGVPSGTVRSVGLLRVQKGGDILSNGGDPRPRVGAVAIELASECMCSVPANFYAAAHKFYSCYPRAESHAKAPALGRRPSCDHQAPYKLQDPWQDLRRCTITKDTRQNFQIEFGGPATGEVSFSAVHVHVPPINAGTRREESQSRERNKLDGGCVRPPCYNWYSSRFLGCPYSLFHRMTSGSGL